jgi:hypothetical protein
VREKKLFHSRQVCGGKTDAPGCFFLMIKPKLQVENQVQDPYNIQFRKSVKVRYARTKNREIVVFGYLERRLFFYNGVNMRLPFIGY